MNNEFEDEERKKDFIISDAFVSIKNCLLLAQSYMENREELSENTPLHQIFDDIERALKQVQPYYEELDCIK